MADVVESLNALAKEVFGQGVPDLVPNGIKLQTAMPFSAKQQQLGLKYVQTVRLAYPSGFTHALGDGTAGAFSLGDSIGGVQKRAEVTGAQILLRDQMSYEDAAKCASGREAFKEGTAFFFEGMQKAFRKRLEVELLYGAQGLGTISGTPATSGSNKVITISAAQWAAGIWSGFEGMQLDAYNGASKVNTNAVLALVSVDVVNKKITVSGNSTDLAALASGHTLYYVGAYGNEFTGIHGVLNNSGSLFSIDASVYSLWAGTQYAPSSGALSFNKVKKAIALGVSKGLDEDVDLYMSPGAWDDVLNDIAALRKTDKSEVKKVEIGAEEIVFHSQNGMCRLVPSMYIKEGFAYGLASPKSYWKRIGAQDVTFKNPGFGDQMFFQLQTKAGVEARAYTHQAVFCEAPCKNFLISNIVNSTP
jgi:hypothetical protein